MKLLLKAATIVDAKGPFNLKKRDILMESGKISKIATSIKNHSSYKIFEAENLHFSLGWIDSLAHFCDPGLEHKEDFASGVKASKSGGFTGVVLSPETQPVTDTKAQVEYLFNLAKTQNLDVFPMGALSLGLEGKELPELLDMYHSGVRIFGDGFSSKASDGLVLRALQYLRATDARLHCFAYEPELVPDAVMNEGAVSTRLGLKGSPALSEELAVHKCLQLLRYADSSLNLCGLSTVATLKQVQKAKKDGLDVTTTLASYQLLFQDSDLEEFDANLKVEPPFRSKSENKALLKSLAQGEIDALASFHKPQDSESKNVEFEYAEMGIINLQTSFSAARTSTEGFVDLDQLLSYFTAGPRKILGLSTPPIEVGCRENYTLFDPDLLYEFTPEMSHSKALNSPLFHRQLRGKALATIYKGRLNLIK